MIVFEKIRYKNFLSVGNKFLEFSFTNGKKTLIVGKNGSGKTLIADALCFALYGKAFRKIRKDQLINSINQKDCVVELDFSIGTNEYKIIRSIKPNSVELYINGKLKDQDASVHDYQEYIEKNVIGMTEKTFRQIVVLGSSAYVPFMSLPAWHRRIIVEDILSVEIFSKMYDVLKRRMSMVKETLSDLEGQSKLINNSIQLTQESIKKFSTSNEDLIQTNDTKIFSIQNEISEIEKMIISQSEKVSEFGSVIQQIQDKIKASNQKKTKVFEFETKFKNSLSTLKNENDFYSKNDVCHTCHQPLEADFKNSKIFANEQKIEEFKSAIDASQKKIKELQNEIDSANESISKMKEQANSIKEMVNEKKALEKQLHQLNDMNIKLKATSKTETVELKRKVKDYNSQLADVKGKIDEINKSVSELSYIAELLKDDGIKSKIVKTYLTVINKLIKKYLDIMNFNIDFKFNEHFEETILARYRDNFSYENFSEGEKLRIDLCLLFTWRELARIKNSASVNLIVLDEIGDSTLDSFGFESFMDILNENIEKQCVIIISHKPDNIATKVDEVIEYHKNGNFTEIKSITKNNSACMGD